MIPLTDGRAENWRNLGELAVSPNPDARWEVLRLIETAECTTVEAALKLCGVSWGSVSRWRDEDTEDAARWREGYAHALDTLADRHAEQAGRVLDEAEAKILALDKDQVKAASALTGLARQKSAWHQWRAERQGRKRWAPDVGTVGNGTPTQVVVLLPQLDPAPQVAARVAQPQLPQAVSADYEIHDTPIVDVSSVAPEPQ